MNGGYPPGPSPNTILLLFKTTLNSGKGGGGDFDGV